MSVSLYVAVLVVLVVAYYAYTQGRRAQAQRRPRYQSRVRPWGYGTRMASPAAARDDWRCTWQGAPIPRCFYAVLEVDPRARQVVIKRAYTALMQDCHPDHGGDTEETMRMNTAYEVLGDPAKRHLYDVENGYC